MLNRSERIADILAGVLTTLVLLVLYAPVFISAIFSVVQVNDGRIMWETFSLQNYVSMWSNPSVVDALSNTAIVAASAVAIASLLAVLALTLSFDETLISVFLAGDRMTLPLRLWAMMRVGFTPEINALVTLVLLVSLVLAALVASRLRIGNSNPE